MKQPSVAFVNDTSLYSSHFGCQLVCQTFREQFSRVGLKLRYSFPRDFNIESVSKYLKNVDLIVVNGEGSIHHGQCQHLIRLAGTFPSVLVNCVYEENPIIPELKSFLYIAARESLSADDIKNKGADCDTVPDVIFSSSLLRSYIREEPYKEIGYTDNVVAIDDRIKNLSTQNLIHAEKILVSDYLRYLTSFKKLCIGRFHAAIVSAIYGIPFSSWDSNTWKIRGVMKDMGVEHLHFRNFSDASENIPSEFNTRIGKYSEKAPKRVNEMFEKIAKIAKEITTDKTFV